MQVTCDAGQHHLDRDVSLFCLLVSLWYATSILNPTVLHLPAVLTVEARNVRILLLTTLRHLGFDVQGVTPDFDIFVSSTELRRRHFRPHVDVEEQSVRSQHRTL